MNHIGGTMDSWYLRDRIYMGSRRPQQTESNNNGCCFRTWSTLSDKCIVKACYVIITHISR